MLKYRVSHIPQVPGKPFEQVMGSFLMAVRVGMILAEYDMFQFEENIKPDYSNAQSIEVSADGGKTWEPCDEDRIEEFERQLRGEF